MATLYIDMDDVLAETGEGIVTIVNREFGTQYTFHDIITFDLKNAFSLNDREWAHLYDVIHRPQEMGAFGCMEGARSILEQWAELGHTIAIVTGRPAKTEAISRAWLEAYNLPYHSLTMVDKYGREPDRKKAISLEELSLRHFDLAVEDSPQMALHLAQTMHLPVMLYDRPWNQSLNPGPQIQRAFNWNEIAHFADSILKL
jgi:uncharacterized HAD superfamily protein